MTTRTLNRRDLLGTTAKGLAAFAALSGTAGFSSSLAGANVCIANHRRLARSLELLIGDPSVGRTEKAHALKTCRCIHCDVAIAPIS